jgi:hypothetical protein
LQQIFRVSRRLRPDQDKEEGSNLLSHVGWARPTYKDGETRLAQGDTERSKLFKIAARVKITVRKVWISFATSYPYGEIFDQILKNIDKIPIKV